MSAKLLTEHHLEFLSLKGGCTGSSESTLFKMPNRWKSRALAHNNTIPDKRPSNGTEGKDMTTLNIENTR